MIVLELAILIALAVTFIVDYTGIYETVLSKLRINIKPFNCSLCMSFWTSVIVALFICNIYMIALPFVTGMLQIVIRRLIALIPITLD